MSRLSGVLDPDERASLAVALAATAVAAASTANLDVIVVSSAPEVLRWLGSVGARSWPDPGGGLSAAADAATTALRDAPWIVMHADLPLVTALALTTVADASAFWPVLVPSHDGGTNVVAANGGFPFSYGPGSFHRHFAAVPRAKIIPSAELSIDIDTPLQLSSFPELRSTPTLNP